MVNQNISIDRNTILKGFRFAIILSLFISAFLILYTLDCNALKRALNNINPNITAALIILIIINWILAGLTLKILISTIDDHLLSLNDCIIIYLAGSFISNVTPFASGGGPFQIYFLHKKGIKIGKASTIIVIEFILRIFFFAVATLIFLLFFNSMISPGIIPLYLFYLAFGFGFLFAALMLIFTFVPGIVDRFINMIFRIKKVREFVKKSRKTKKILVRAKRELEEFRCSLDVLRQYKGRLILAELCTIAYWSSLFLIIPLILKGLGLKPFYFKSYVMQTIFYLILPYMPTPGASGIAEIGFASLFVSFIPKNLIGLVTFVWRFFTFYIILLVGGIFTLREIGRNRGN